MASQVCVNSVSAKDLLTKAKEKGISCHGEMFSVDAMRDLANDMLKGVRASTRRDVLPSSIEVIKILLDGDFILFPYDAEPNHVPGFKNGRKAHWGLLCGCLIQNKGLHFRHETTPFKADSKTDHLWHLRPTPQMFNIDRCSSVPPSKASPKQSIRVSRSVSPYHSLGEESILERLAKRLGYTTEHQIIKEDFTVIGLFRQGKSRNLIYVPLVDICNSNSQLYEYPDTEGYIIDSVEKGLCGQVVILQKEIHGLSDLLGTLQE